MVDKKDRKANMAALKKKMSKSFGMAIYNLGTDEKDIFGAEFYKTGYDNFDEMLNGGLARGDCIELYGREGSGKTSFALQIIGNMVRKYKLSVLYIDQEHALDIDWATQLIGEKEIKSVNIVQPDFLEQMAEAIKESILSEVVDFIVVDTWGSAIPSKIFEGDMGDLGGIGLKARVEGQILNQLTPVIAKSKIPVLVLNQMRTKKAGKNFIDDSAGGWVMRHLMKQRVFFHSPKKIVVGDTIKSFNVVAETKKNKHGRPYRKCTLKFEMEEGYDKIWSRVEAMLNSGEIVLNGAYYKYKEKSHYYGDLKEVLIAEDSNGNKKSKG